VIETAVLSFGLVLMRVSTFIVVLPVFSGRNLPHTVKIGLAVALSAFWWSCGVPSEFLAALTSSGWGSMPAWCMAAVREVLLGGALGFALGLFLVPVQIAGAFIAQEMGLNLATQTDPSGQAAATNVSQLFHSLGILLFFALNLHHTMLGVLHTTFFNRPIGSDFTLPSATRLLNGMTEVNESGLLLAAPVAAALFIALLVLMTTMRTAPQLNLFSVGLPFRLAVGLIAAAVFFPEFCNLAARIFARMSNVAYW
jgi:flagellar biosynthetic protein FliR